MISPAARRLLREYFDAPSETSLPVELADWLETGSDTLRRSAGARRLTIERSGEALLLVETRDDLSLTSRDTAAAARFLGMLDESGDA